MSILFWKKKSRSTKSIQHKKCAQFKVLQKVRIKYFGRFVQSIDDRIILLMWFKTSSRCFGYRIQCTHVHRLCFVFGNSYALMQRGRLSWKGDFHLIRLLPEIETTEEDPIFWILSLLLCGFFVSCVQISTESKLYADKKIILWCTAVNRVHM